ncbi:MAG: hypothetical protein KGL39_32070 [Patescibacteria group bacterium]|nr:hypothetical protein [Patescibacteria group bacterium]
MGKVVKKSDGAGFFAKGGSGHMFGKGSASPAVEGQSGRDAQVGSSGKFAVGGKGHMFGKGSASPAEPGVSSKNSQ